MSMDVQFVSKYMVLVVWVRGRWLACQILLFCLFPFVGSVRSKNGKRFYKAAPGGLVWSTKPRNLVGIARNTLMYHLWKAAAPFLRQVARRYLVGWRKSVTLLRKIFCDVEHLVGKMFDKWLEPPRPPKTAKGMCAERYRTVSFLFPLVQGFHKALFLYIFLSFILSNLENVVCQ